MSAKDTFYRKLDGIGWGLFFIWIGIAVVGSISWGWSLLGVSAIVLGAQAILYLGRRRVDGFMTAFGFLLLICAVAELFPRAWLGVAALLIVLGAAMLGRTLVGSKPVRRTAHRSQRTKYRRLETPRQRPRS